MVDIKTCSCPTCRQQINDQTSLCVVDVKDFLCVICFEEESEYKIKLSCGHVFCGNCINNWFNTKYESDTSNLSNIDFYYSNTDNNINLIG
jgi:uncharacterized protein YacL (UPF0231 family)